MKEKKRRRTTQQVKDDILQAVENVLEKHGANKLGVEAVAAEAGMDKSMLYRHYENFNDILRTSVEQEYFWLNSFIVEEKIQITRNNVADIINNIIKNQFKELLTNNKIKQLLIWELTDTNELMKGISQQGEDLAVNILNKIRVFFPHKNISSNNIIAIITAGVYFLVLHKDVSTFATIDINNKEQQEKLLSDLSWLISQIFSPITETERIVLNCIEKGFDNELIADITEINIERITQLRMQ